MDNITFPYKTALSEANVKANRMGSTKLTYHKEWSFASNHFPFLKILFQFRNLVYRVDLMYQPPKCPYSYLNKTPTKILEFYFRVFFPYEYPEWKYTYIVLKLRVKQVNVRVKYIMSTQKGQSQKKINLGFRNLI